MGLLGGAIRALVALYNVVVSAGRSVVSVLTGSAKAVVAVVLSGLWSIAIVVGLIVGGAVLQRVGVDDVHATLDTRLFGGETTQGIDVEDVPDVEAAAVTDDAGRFSPAAFERVTGMMPPEFIHLFVRCHGGRVKQTTINRCLPWSKATVSRYLDTLEENGMVRRVTIDRRNVVCTPENAPTVSDHD